MKAKIELSIIYVNYNVEKLLLRSIESILARRTKYKYEIIVVDNSRSIKSNSRLRDIGKVNIIDPMKNLGFGNGCNLGAKYAKGKYLLFLNPDTIIYEESIDKMVSAIDSDKKIGIVGPKLVDRRGRVLPSISKRLTKISHLVVFSKINSIWRKNPISASYHMDDFDREIVHDVDVVSGACMLIRRSLFEKVGMFDKNVFLYFEEHDLCNKVQNAGYRVVYFPYAKICHLVGKSLTDKEKIKKSFEKTRFFYAKKNFGLVYAIGSEIILRGINFNTFFALFIFILTLFMNTYRIGELMLFIGDAARDFLAAREMVLSQSLPLVGIPSSVVWLHQGPISVWLIGLAFSLSGFNPLSPAILFGIIGAITSVLIFILGRKYFDRNVGIISSIFFATSPMIVVNSRMPYHTAIIPFFATLFFMSLLKSGQRHKLLPVAMLLIGLLLQVELSNAVVIGIVGLLIVLRKIKIDMQSFFSYLLFGVLGVLPFILYEIKSGPSYVLFPFWILNRLRLFMGIAADNGSTASSLPGTIQTIYQQSVSVAFPHLALLGLAMLLFSLSYLIWKSISSQRVSYLILSLWILVPIGSYVLHSSPGTAYFALLYPAISLMLGIYFSYLFNKSKIFVVLFLIIITVNITTTFKNDFYVTTSKGPHPMPPSGYNFGASWVLDNEVAKAILFDANNAKFSLEGSRRLNIFSTSLDTYKFLILNNKGNLSDNSDITYTIYTNSEIVTGNVIYQGSGGIVVKEKK